MLTVVPSAMGGFVRQHRCGSHVVLTYAKYYVVFFKCGPENIDLPQGRAYKIMLRIESDAPCASHEMVEIKQLPGILRWQMVVRNNPKVQVVIRVAVGANEPKAWIML